MAEGDDAASRPRALSGLGWALLQDGKPAEAADAFGTLLERPRMIPNAPEAALARGRALDEAGQADRGDRGLCPGARSDIPRPRRRPRPTLARARLLAKAKHPAEAADAFARVPRRPPQGRPRARADVVLAEWGWALLDADKPAEADKAFARLLDEFPDSPRADDARLESGRIGLPGQAL